MPALRRVGLSSSGVEKIERFLITAPLQIMSQHRRRIGTKLLLELKDSIQRFRNLLRLAFGRCLHELLQRFA